MAQHAKQPLDPHKGQTCCVSPRLSLMGNEVVSCYSMMEGEINYFLIHGTSHIFFVSVAATKSYFSVAIKRKTWIIFSGKMK